MLFMIYLYSALSLVLFSVAAYTPLRSTVDVSDAYPARLNALGILNQPQVHQVYNTNDIYLFQKFPSINRSIPYFSLGSLPTPVQRCNALSEPYDVSIWCKRDDLTGGFNQLLYGGNKVRKLEFLLAQALAYGATHVATFGCVGSNHATATAVYAETLMLKCTNFLKHQEPSPVVTQNLLLSHASRADLRWYPDNHTRRVGSFAHWLDTYSSKGEFVYVIPTGGSNPVGALGFVNAGLELAAQIDAGLLSQPQAIYVAAGSLGTLAGLTLGLQIAEKNIKIIGVATEPHESEVAYYSELKELYTQTNNLLCSHDSAIPTYPFPENLVEIRFEFAGVDYGVPTPEGTAAQELFKIHELLNLDQTYTAKAAACLLADASLKRFEHVLFWNTYCGLDFHHITDKVNRDDLPVSLQEYL